MPKLSTIVSVAVALMLAQDAFAAGPMAVRPSAPPPASAAPARPKVDPAKLRDCQRAWEMQRIKKGSRRAFVRACVRHG